MNGSSVTTADLFGNAYLGYSPTGQVLLNSNKMPLVHRLRPLGDDQGRWVGRPSRPRTQRSSQFPTGKAFISLSTASRAFSGSRMSVGTSPIVAMVLDQTMSPVRRSTKRA